MNFKNVMMEIMPIEMDVIHNAKSKKDFNVLWFQDKLNLPAVILYL